MACVIPKTMLVKVSDFITDPVAQLEMIESYFSLPNTKLLSAVQHEMKTVQGSHKLDCIKVF